VIPSLPVETVIDAIYLPPVEDKESTRVVLLYVQQIHNRGQFFLL
jgi:hypothetical protein